MNLHLTFGDLVRLGANHNLEKDGVTITVDNLPMMSEIAYDPRNGTGKVAFWLEEEDTKSR